MTIFNTTFIILFLAWIGIIVLVNWANDDE